MIRRDPYGDGDGPVEPDDRGYVAIPRRQSERRYRWRKIKRRKMVRVAGFGRPS